MKDKIFFDTNIIVYAFDESNPKKKRICEKFVEKAFKGEIIGYVSNQILSEIFVVLTKKVGRPLGKSETTLIVESIIDSEKWKKVNYTETTIKKVLRDIKEINASFWDLLIAETMKENGIDKIITENEKDFKRIEGIKVLNPFKS